MKRIGSITYNEAGTSAAAGNSIPIICLHGIGGNADSFAPQLADLNDVARVISWNMPGYGGSKLLDKTTFSSLGAALARFMDDLDIKTAHLIGQSIGGMIALDFALTHGDRVRSLALIATTSAFGGRDETFKTKFLRARLEPLEQGRSMPELAAAFVPQIIGPNTAPKAITAAIKSMAAVSPESYRAIMSCLITFDRRADLDKLDLPVCLIAGSRDQNAPENTMARMAQKIAGAQYHVIKDAGHLINLEAAEATNDILKTYYAQQMRTANEPDGTT